MVNKDFIRQLLCEDKQLMALNDMKFVNVPVFDELSVKILFPHCRDIPEIMSYFPDPTPKSRLPERDYFFNVLNTLN